MPQQQCFLLCTLQYSRIIIIPNTTSTAPFHAVDSKATFASGSPYSREDNEHTIEAKTTRGSKATVTRKTKQHIGRQVLSRCKKCSVGRDLVYSFHNKHPVEVVEHRHSSATEGSIESEVMAQHPSPVTAAASALLHAQQFDLSQLAVAAPPHLRNNESLKRLPLTNPQMHARTHQRACGNPNPSPQPDNAPFTINSHTMKSKRPHFRSARVPPFPSSRPWIPQSRYTPKHQQPPSPQLAPGTTSTHAIPMPVVTNAPSTLSIRRIAYAASDECELTSATPRPHRQSDDHYCILRAQLLSLRNAASGHYPPENCLPNHRVPQVRPPHKPTQGRRGNFETTTVPLLTVI
ncbi:hypothetical protein EGR_10951 [Echinococcus granulosus]|uniref:Uncharacterized protein n=1 Tax=Echinococcus granulosus TaxID=6210 RepID=W6TZF2_ECHGR|nr:hypothetical protein EGR_10951 [Echinococcus granulosus]EUB54190.1 hypothetical protein EGR_10951 [Echinococcus granulosus]